LRGLQPKENQGAIPQCLLHHLQLQLLFRLLNYWYWSELLSPDSLTFTPANWNVPQTVTVNTSNNSTADGDVTVTIATGKPTSNDANYNNLSAADTNDFTITLVDDEIDADSDGFMTMTMPFLMILMKYRY